MKGERFCSVRGCLLPTPLAGTVLGGPRGAGEFRKSREGSAGVYGVKEDASERDEQLGVLKSEADSISPNTQRPSSSLLPSISSALSSSSELFAMKSVKLHELQVTHVCS